MFEPISDLLRQLAMFAVLGFFLAALYEPLRISRLFIRTGAVAVGIEDFLFLAFCGVITFAYSMEFGAGEIRLFFLLGEAFGATVYFLTAGKLIITVTRAVARAVISAVKKLNALIKKRIILPIRKQLVKFVQFLFKKIGTIYKTAENNVKDLKNKAELRYNNNKSNSRKKKGEARNVIKAQIRKKT